MTHCTGDSQRTSNFDSCRVVGQHLLSENNNGQTGQVVHAVDNENELIENLKQF